ncbi:hypothetical protein Fmac_026305 [Flemingia macrophylla]|uniref:Uncharacterized protein n=1 Tax=Flemingia macrophylla TaxID=520843 RepID=A0ABD1LEH0_9FABA
MAKYSLHHCSFDPMDENPQLSAIISRPRHLYLMPCLLNSTKCLSDEMCLCIPLPAIHSESSALRNLDPIVELPLEDDDEVPLPQAGPASPPHSTPSFPCVLFVNRNRKKEKTIKDGVVHKEKSYGEKFSKLLLIREKGKKNSSDKRTSPPLSTSANDPRQGVNNVLDDMAEDL